VENATAASAVEKGDEPLAKAFMARAISKARTVARSAIPKRAALLAEILVESASGIAMPSFSR
jgi:hypothetical protein